MKKGILMTLSLMFILTACTGVPAPSPGGGDTTAAPSRSAAPAVQPVAYKAALVRQPVGPLDAAFVNGINAFGFKAAGMLYSRDKNLAISPVSIELALAMTRTGAAGETAKEMAEALSLQGLSDEQIVSACKALMWRANTGGMKAANSLWVYEGYPFSKDFIKGCTDDFMADVMPLKIPGAMGDINKWAKENTNGKIDKILSREPDEMTRLILCNALYFLGKWETPFDANDTFDEQFNAAGGAVTTSFMHGQWGIRYYEDDKFSMIALPFKSGDGEGKYAMAFMLPKEGTDLSGMLSALDSGGFSKAVSGLAARQVKVSLPKFKFSYYTQLNDTLKGLGMKAAFSDQADFGPMTGSDNDLYVSDVLHKCFISVDELGAEAAAVTAVEMRLTAVMPGDDVTVFNADRPFAFAVYSVEDGAVAFMGAVNNPAAE